MSSTPELKRCKIVEVDLLKQLNDRASLNSSKNAPLSPTTKLRHLSAIVMSLSQEQSEFQNALNQVGSSSKLAPTAPISGPPQLPWSPRSFVASTPRVETTRVDATRRNLAPLLENAPDSPSALSTPRPADQLPSRASSPIFTAAVSRSTLEHSATETPSKIDSTVDTSDYLSPSETTPKAVEVAKEPESAAESIAPSSSAAASSAVAARPFSSISRFSTDISQVVRKSTRHKTATRRFQSSDYDD